jgi:hypothetical protein
MLQQQEPYPLAVLAADYRIVRRNSAASRLFELFVQEPALAVETAGRRRDLHLCWSVALEQGDEARRRLGNRPGDTRYVTECNDVWRRLSRVVEGVPVQGGEQAA